MSYLSYDAVSKWRVLSQAIPGWEHTKSWGNEIRANAAKLNPPFNPDDEAIIFDASIFQGGLLKSAAEPRLIQLSYRGVSITDGWLVASENRLLFGTGSTIYGQIPYEEIKAIYTGGSKADKPTFTIATQNSESMIITAKTHGISWFQLMTGLAAPPGGKTLIANTEQQKYAEGEAFVNEFAAFFTEIVDENRRRRAE